MTEWFSGIGGIVSQIFAAFGGGPLFALKTAMGQPSFWTLCLLVTLAGGYLAMLLYRHVPVVEKYLEPSIMVVSYLAIGGIIFVEVIRRFVWGLQEPWSSTLPPFLFLIMTWVGCSYNVKLRTHLSFSEIRNVMGRGGQYAMLLLDTVLWLGFCWVVVVTGFQVTVNSAANFQIMAGTNNVMQWWFLITMPLTFVLLAGRVLQNAADDRLKLRDGRPLIEQAVIGGQ